MLLASLIGNPIGAQASKTECRGACFSSSGNNLFSIQNALVNPKLSHLVKWTISSSPKEESKDSNASSSSPDSSPEKDEAANEAEISSKLNITPEK
jgi:hypothetical protein